MPREKTENALMKAAFQGEEEKEGGKKKYDGFNFNLTNAT